MVVDEVELEAWIEREGHRPMLVGDKRVSRHAPLRMRSDLGMSRPEARRLRVAPPAPIPLRREAYR